MRKLSLLAAAVLVGVGVGLGPAKADTVFETSVLASAGGSVAVAGVRSTGAEFVILPGGEIKITDEGNIKVEYEGLFRASDLRTTAELVFASVVCDGVIVHNTESVPVDQNTGLAEIEDEDGLAGVDPLACRRPIVLIRRDGCTEASGCGSDDPSNTRWLAISGFTIPAEE